MNTEHVPHIPSDQNLTRIDYVMVYLGLLEARGYDIGSFTYSISPNAWQKVTNSGFLK